MEVILIANYPLDRQESMERFAQMLSDGLNEAGVETQIWRPTVFFASAAQRTNKGIFKWLGYLDKWILFSLVLRWRVFIGGLGNKDGVYFHICDHSNAPYLQHLPSRKTTITCHDVLAIRGAFGFSDAHCDATAFGKLLQRWIFNNLSKSKRLAAVSQLTLTQLEELQPTHKSLLKDWRVIHNAFNSDYFPLPSDESEPLLKVAGIDTSIPYLLHVGQSHQRKNRKMLLDMVHLAGDRWLGNICFAGQPIDDELKKHAQELNLSNRIISVVKPSNIALLALYSNCYAFVFPSFSEGFGWPIIEAQACGVPVIASNVEPMPEVSGKNALHASPFQPQEFANALLALSDEKLRSELIEGGFKNSRRFGRKKMIEAYLDLLNIEKQTLVYG
ncbi:glycosyltransferase family 4 protein [Desertivirga brevis]|uniref:glycosyltransferase family 4 protein n=1 Tax=Desertivirga brevis TaxID=2810310 RepID=UPI001A96CEF5|nr:glycosyltransferase family 1 protein [Pedobacter sp. SYSU D00873]